MQPLTQRQQDYLDAINAHRAQHGVSPTLREIAVAVGISPNSTVSVRSMLSVLARKGYLELAPSIHRGIYPVVRWNASRVSPRWRPIEVAPKKKTLLLWTVPPGSRKGHYRIGRWSHISESWEDGNGCTLSPTHWQHLPEPPPCVSS